jgi:hypothetical protein
MRLLAVCIFSFRTQNCAEDEARLGWRNWTVVALNREGWRKLLKGAEAHPGLECRSEWEWNSKLCPVSGSLIDGSVSYSVNSHSSLESILCWNSTFFFLRYKMPNSTAYEHRSSQNRTRFLFCIPCSFISESSFNRPEHVLQFKHYILQISNQVTW